MKIRKDRARLIRYRSDTNTVKVDIQRGHLPCVEIRDSSNGDLRAAACVYGKEQLRKLIEVLNVVLCDLPEDPVCEEDDD
jgi:Asp-tRNA(Asn)/Glu-tRNA(Gln) amidotransferase B subunit